MIASNIGNFVGVLRRHKMPIFGALLSILDTIEITIPKNQNLDTIKSGKKLGKNYLMKGQKKSPSHHRLAGLAKSF